MGVWLWLNLGHNDAMVMVEVLQVFFFLGDFGGWGLGLWVVVAMAMGVGSGGCGNGCGFEFMI